MNVYILPKSKYFEKLKANDMLENNTKCSKKITFLILKKQPHSMKANTELKNVSPRLC